MPESLGESSAKLPGCANTNPVETPVANPEDIDPVASGESSGVMTLGSGSGAVYVYYYPRDKKLAEFDAKIRVGMQGWYDRKRCG